jgi:hypothetical protein
MFQRARTSDPPPLPQVVVSAAPPDLDPVDHHRRWPTTPNSAPPETTAGRSRSVSNSSSVNYSRPGRPSLVRSENSEDAKRKVLERNQVRKSPSSGSQLSSYYYDPRAASSASSLTSLHTPIINAPPKPIRPRNNGSGSSPILSSGPSQPLSPNSLSSPRAIAPTSIDQAPTLYSHPQANSSTHSSLYSSYSFYQYEEALPSPVSGGNTSQFLGPPSPLISQSSHYLSPTGYSSPSLSPSPSPIATSPTSSPGSDLKTSDDYLQLGIRHHEANRLRDSAACFEKSARLAESEKGASGVGMLMWGLTLRHGWGCEKNEKKGFSWLRRAAEAAVGDLEKARVDTVSNAIKGELVLAIYEVGQCFFQGWGVKKDQKMALVRTSSICALLAY